MGGGGGIMAFTTPTITATISPTTTPTIVGIPHLLPNLLQCTYHDHYYTYGLGPTPTTSTYSSLPTTNTTIPTPTTAKPTTQPTPVYLPRPLL